MTHATPHLEITASGAILLLVDGDDSLPVGAAGDPCRWPFGGGEPGWFPGEWAECVREWEDGRRGERHVERAFEGAVSWFE